MSKGKKSLFSKLYIGSAKIGIGGIIEGDYFGEVDEFGKATGYG